MSLKPILFMLVAVAAGCGSDPAQTPGTTTGRPDTGAPVVDMGSSSSDTGDGRDAATSDASNVPDADATDATTTPDLGTSDVATGDMADAALDMGGSDVMAATALSVVIDRDIDVAPTPINQAYVAEIDATVAGDRIYSYQKYFHSEPMNQALVDAARRGVEVRGYYGEDVDPSCGSLLDVTDTIDCSTIFVKATAAHHKNMMILRGDGTVRGIVGSYNPRERNVSDPRMHTVLLLEVANGQPLFDFYTAEAARLTGAQTTQPVTMSVPVTAGGELKFTFHPGPASPVLDLLNSISSCDGTLWLSYFDILPDSVATPVFDRLQALKNGGCDVRVLLDGQATNLLARLSMQSRGIPVEEPDFVGGGTLGHKIVSVVSGGEAHLMQGSANLNLVNHNVNNNLSVYIHLPTTELTNAIDAELLRYWP